MRNAHNILFEILIDRCNLLTVNLLHQTLSHLMSRMRFPPGNLRIMSA